MFFRKISFFWEKFKAYFIYSILFLLCIFGSYVIFFYNLEDEINEDAIRSVMLSKVVAASEFADIRTFSGYSISNKTIDLSFRIGGKINQLLVNLGDELFENTLIASLDSVDYELDLTSKIAKFESAKADRIKLFNNYERIKDLYEFDSSSKKELEEARALWRGGESNVTAAKMAMSLARRRFEYTHLYFSYEDIELNRCAKCFVSNKIAEVGENVNEGQPIITIDCFKDLDVEFFIPETLINRLNKGDLISIFFVSLSKDEEFKARIKEIDCIANMEKGLYKVKATVLSQDARLKPGMNIEAVFDFYDKKNDGFYVPQSSIVGDSSGVFVYVFEKDVDSREGIVRKVPIQIFERNDSFVRVKGDISDISEIVSAGTRYMVDGKRVRREYDIKIEKLEVER